MQARAVGVEPKVEERITRLLGRRQLGRRAVRSIGSVIGPCTLLDAKAALTIRFERYRAREFTNPRASSQDVLTILRVRTMSSPLTRLARPRFSIRSRLVAMGIDWENVLGTSGNGLNDAYDSAVSAVIYNESPGDDRRPLPVGEEHDDTDGLR